MFAEYDEMVAAGLERQKKMNNEANDQIRDTYMGKLGVHQQQSTEDSTKFESETSSLRIAAKDRGNRIGNGTETEDSRSMTNTIDMHAGANEKI